MRTLAVRPPSSSMFYHHILLIACPLSSPFRIAETLPDEVLAKMHAPPKRDYSIITPAQLPSFDAYLFGIPTRYGNFPAQWKVGIFDPFPRPFVPSRNANFILLKAFWDATGGLWSKGALAGKFAGVFVSTGTPGGGQETTVISSLSTLVHHGMIFVPLGYSRTFGILGNMSEVRGGTLLVSHEACECRWLMYVMSR